jgi:uncharacterized DUF497 family protein
MRDWSSPEFDWDDANEDHVLRHDVYPEEAEQVFYNGPYVRRHRDRYVVMGQDDAGRYLIVVCERRGGRVRVITARTMEQSERRHYDRHR